MCTHNLCFEQNKKKSYNFSSEYYNFYSREILLYIAWACFRNDISWCCLLDILNAIKLSCIVLILCDLSDIFICLTCLQKIPAGCIYK